MGEYKHIYNINSPEYLKDKSIDELYEISNEIREFIIEKVSEQGGHLSANLGVVEAVVAMHYVFDSPYDKMIFDVGHQSYAHKILTGRAKEFDNLRTMKGICGFPSYKESEHDVYETGHSSTSIGAMIGFLEEKKNNPDELGEVISFIGDASFQNGLSLSATNYLGSRKDLKGIIILNDNEMSISKNVGRITQIFNKLRLSKKLYFVRKITTNRFRNKVKNLFYKDCGIFTQLGFSYLGPIDGHNLKELIEAFKFAKEKNQSIIVHIKTIKGKGFDLAEKDKIGYYHGIGPFYKETGIQKRILQNDEVTLSNGIGNLLTKVCELNKNVKVITPAMTYGMGLTNLSMEYPESLIDVGISEELAVSMASGMAKFNTIPIVCTYSTFFQRAYDEILNDVSRTDSHVIFMVDRGGIVSGDGPTHQGMFDISMFNSMPNVIVSSPSTLCEAKELINIALETKHPFVIRYPKCIVKNTLKGETVEFGKWNIVRDIKDVNIISYGPVVTEINKAITDKKLTDSIGLINALFIKPFDENVLRSLKGKTVFVYEEVINNNSLASNIEIYSYQNKLNINIIPFSFKDYTVCGTLEEIKDKYDMQINTLINKAKEELKK